MTKSTNLFKSPLQTMGLTLALLGGLNCMADQDITPAADPVNQSVDKEKIAVKKKMNPNEQIAFSKQDLATRLGLEKDAVKVSGATPVNWRSGALGCPKPGVNYTDVLVPGAWIVLKADSVTYRYHAARGYEPFYCPDEQAEPPVLGPGAD